MLYFNGEKVFIFKSAKCLGTQIANLQITNLQITRKIGSVNRKSAKCHICGQILKSNKLFKSANLRICDLWNLFALDLALYTVIPFQVQKQEKTARILFLIHGFCRGGFKRGGGGVEGEGAESKTLFQGRINQSKSKLIRPPIKTF